MQHEDTERPQPAPQAAPAPAFKVGDKVLIKAKYGIGLNRTFRRAVSSRRPATVTGMFMDAALVEVYRGAVKMSAWVNAKEIVHAS